MKTKYICKPAAIAVGTVICGSLATSAIADNDLFSLSESDRHNAATAEKGLRVLEGKCGEGKCGTLRIRLMMDLDHNGYISRQEYVTWAAAQADSEFDRIAGLHNNSSTPGEVLRNDEWHD